MEIKSSYCLVSSGGGAKGVYHIGVWRALQELGIKVDAFVGNSIGAVIAGFLAQGETEKLEAIGSQIGLDFILNIPEEFIKKGEFRISSAKQFSVFKKFYLSIIAKKGLDTSPLRELLKQNLNELRIRDSGNDLGVVTFSLSDIKPREIYIEDMEPGHLLDYLLASSAFPGFTSPEIASKKYIDGGVYDNIPYNMALKRGYKRLIVVDISGMGVKRKLDISGRQVIYIKNSINMGSVLDFDREFLNRFMYLGYLDTLRVFGEYEGQNFYIEPNISFSSQFKSLLKQSEFQQKLNSYTNIYSGKTNLKLSLLLKDIFPKQMNYNPNWLSVFCDCAATCLNIEKIKVWSYQNLFDEIEHKRKLIDVKVEKYTSKDEKWITSLIKERINERKLIEDPYFYFRMVNNLIPKQAQKLLFRGLFSIFPELKAGAFFIEELSEFEQGLSSVEKNNSISIQES